MTATLPTLNATVEQIEHDLRAGKSVDDVCTEWQEPRSNVIGVLRAMQARGDKPESRQPAPPVAGARALTSVPQRPTPPTGVSGQQGLAVDALVNAAARSASKRTQALGVKLADLVADIRKRLVAEREAAERAEAERAEREAAAREVKRLEDALREARARAGMRGAGIARGNTSPRTAKQIAALAAARARAHGEFPCTKGCGKVAATRAGQLAHERHCTGASS